MHRVTSAAVLADSTARQDVEITVEQISEAPSQLSVVPERSESVAFAELDIVDDAPLLQDVQPTPVDATIIRHAQSDAWDRQGTAGTAMQEVVVVLRLAAPVTIQVTAYTSLMFVVFVHRAPRNKCE